MKDNIDLRISVIIPVLNEEEKLGAAIASAWQAGAQEVIVIDGGSSDQSVTVAQSSAALVFVTEPGRGTQLARGAELATGDLLVMLHADSRLETGAFAELRSLSENHAWGCFDQAIDDPRLIFRWVEWGNRIRVRWFSLAYGDQAIWVRHSVLKSIGGIPSVPLMEDVILSSKLSKKYRLHQLKSRTLTSSRRWRSDGIVRRTLRNWSLLFRFLVLHQAPADLVRDYRPHR